MNSFKYIQLSISFRSPVTTPPPLLQRRRSRRRPTLGKVRPDDNSALWFLLGLHCDCPAQFFLNFPLLSQGHTEEEETIPLLTCRLLLLLGLFHQHSLLHPFTLPHCKPTPLHTRLAPALSPLLPLVTNPNLFTQLALQFSILLG